MGAIHYQSLQQNSSNLLLNGLCVGLREEVKECAAEVMGVTVGVAQLICNGIEEQVTACRKGRKILTHRIKLANNQVNY